MLFFIQKSIDTNNRICYNIVTGKRYTTKTQEENIMTYKGYTIDRDNLGRLYIHNNSDPYCEDVEYIRGNSIKYAKKIINQIIQYGYHE